MFQRQQQINRYWNAACCQPFFIEPRPVPSLLKKKKVIEVCQCKMEKKITGVIIKNKVQNTDIRRRTSMRYAAAWVEMHKGRWGGHVALVDQSKWTCVATIWDPRIRKRNLGRLKTRWLDVFKEMIGGQWTHEAQIHSSWRNIHRRLQQEVEHLPLQD
jgi:hypothetical protein